MERLEILRTRRKVAAIVATLGVATVLFAAKLWTIHSYGNPTPFWDQWDAEAAFLFDPYLHGTLHWRTLFSPHNEHRILFTRLLSLLLLEVNGLWSPQLEMVVNAVLHVAAIVALVVLAWRAAGPGTFVPLLALAGVVFFPPYGWENTLAGFQSQFYFLLLFSFSALWLLSTSEAFTRGWWGGVVVATMAYFSLASGVFVLAASAVTMVANCSATRNWRRQLGGAAVLLLLFIGGAKAIPVLPYHAALRASSIAELVEATLQGLAWPYASLWMALVRNAPLLVFLVLAVVRRWPVNDSRWFLFALGMWGLGQTASLGYGRAHDVLASRYLDLHIVTLFANGAVLTLIAAGPSGRLRRMLVAGAAVWVSLCLVGLALCVEDGSLATQLAQKRAASERQEANLLRYLREGDRAWLNGLPFFDLPYPSAQRLASILDSGDVREVLPWELQTPLAPVRGPTGSGFKPGGVDPDTPDCKCDPLGSYDHLEERRNARRERVAYLAETRTWAMPRMAVMVAGFPTRGAKVEVRQQDHLTSLPLAADPGATWMRVTFDVQPGPFELRFADTSSNGWLAVGRPTPTGRMDGYADLALRRWLPCALVGVVLIALGLALGAAGAVRRTEPGLEEKAGT